MKIKQIMFMILILQAFAGSMAYAAMDDMDRPQVFYLCKVSWVIPWCSGKPGCNGISAQFAFGPPMTAAACFAEAPRAMIQENCAVGFPCNTSGNYTGILDTQEYNPYTQKYTDLGSTTCSGTFALAQGKASSCQ